MLVSAAVAFDPQKTMRQPTTGEVFVELPGDEARQLGTVSGDMAQELAGTSNGRFDVSMMCREQPNESTQQETILKRVLPGHMGSTISETSDRPGNR